MATCININSVEFQTLKSKSGLSDFELQAQCRMFLDKYDRFPYLDELVNGNSEPYLKDALKMTGTSAKINNILEVTGTDNIEEANVALNDEFRDLEITLVPLKTSAHVEIEHRPSIYNIKEKEVIEMDEKDKEIYQLKKQIEEMKGMISNANESFNSDVNEQITDTKSTRLQNNKRSNAK